MDTKERSLKIKEERLDHLTDLRTYKLTELETIIGVTHRTLLTYVKEGKLKAKKIGNRWRVTEKDLREFLEAN